METIRVFVGTDESQLLAVKVLEYSIKSHTKRPVEVVPMINLNIPSPRDLKNQARTGFSFYRFCIPQLCGYKGKAVYMDADMQVFKDIGELWDLPFDGDHMILQEELPEAMASARKIGSPLRRWKQCSVMLLNCEALKWDINEIVKDLDQGKYDYDQLMKEMCIVPEDKVGYRLPVKWNSLEHFDSTTANIHYTDMNTQPWVSPFNKNGHVWFKEVHRMLRDGSLKLEELKSYIDRGYFRPTLIEDVQNPKERLGLSFWAHSLKCFLQDRMRGYRPHVVVNQQFELRKAKGHAS